MRRIILISVAALSSTSGLGGCASDPIRVAADDAEMAGTSPDEIIIDSGGRISAVYRLGPNAQADRVIVGPEGQLTFEYDQGDGRQVRVLPGGRLEFSRRLRR